MKMNLLHANETTIPVLRVTGLDAPNNLHFLEGDK